MCIIFKNTFHTNVVFLAKGSNTKYVYFLINISNLKEYI